MKATILISRTSKGTIELTIYDEASREQLCRLTMSHEQFGMAVTGLSTTDIDMSVGNLSRIGKRKVTEKRSVILPFSIYVHGKIKSWLHENAKEDGWEINDYLGSRDSLRYNESGKVVVNYSVFKYI